MLLNKRILKIVKKYLLFIIKKTFLIKVLESLDWKILESSDCGKWGVSNRFVDSGRNLSICLLEIVQKRQNLIKASL